MTFVRRTCQLATTCVVSAIFLLGGGYATARDYRGDSLCAPPKVGVLVTYNDRAVISVTGKAGWLPTSRWHEIYGDYIIGKDARQQIKFKSGSIFFAIETKATILKDGKKFKEISYYDEYSDDPQLANMLACDFKNPISMGQKRKQEVWTSDGKTETKELFIKRRVIRGIDHQLKIGDRVYPVAVIGVETETYSVADKKLLSTLNEQYDVSTEYGVYLKKEWTVDGKKKERYAVSVKGI